NIKFFSQIPNNFEIIPGDIYLIDGRFNFIKNFGNNGFDYVKYSLSKGVYFNLNFPQISYKIDNKNSFIYQKIYDFKIGFLNIVYSSFPKDEANFLAGILMGHRVDIPPDLLEAYNNSGLTHLIAVSGFNITIIVIFFSFIFIFIPIYIRFFLIVLIIIFFCILVGDNPAVIRAGIMGIVSYFIMTLGRNQDSLAVFLFVATIMLILNPMYINYDYGFILSFLAVIGLLYTQNFWKKIFFFLPSFFAIKESFVLTMSAMTTTLPIMLFGFGKLSIVAPIANMLVGGIMPFAMFFGFLSIIINYFNNVFGYYFGFITYFILKFINEVARFLGGLKYGVYNYDFGIYTNYLIIIYLIFLLFLITYFKKFKNNLEIKEGKA
ncbi:MAG: ComEC/Rec2 family competence protein, partial [Candidatus Gracilibacteria bacterium]|nr:ComEC/Rec2 family competence protein [Candidatus Gracilibacteria bacterium]